MISSTRSELACGYTRKRWTRSSGRQWFRSPSLRPVRCGQGGCLSLRLPHRQGAERTRRMASRRKVACNTTVVARYASPLLAELLRPVLGRALGVGSAGMPVSSPFWPTSPSGTLSRIRWSVCRTGGLPPQNACALHCYRCCRRTHRFASSPPFSRTSRHANSPSRLTPSRSSAAMDSPQRCFLPSLTWLAASTSAPSLRSSGVCAQRAGVSPTKSHRTASARASPYPATSGASRRCAVFSWRRSSRREKPFRPRFAALLRLSNVF